MPIYAYRCSNCGHQKDVLQKFSDPPLTACPSCHEQGFARQVTAAAFQLKGSGWYVTDFRDGNKGAQKSSDADKTGADSGTAEGGKAEGGASGTDSATAKDSGAGASTAPSSATPPSATGGSSPGEGASKSAATAAAGPAAPKAG